MSLTHDEAFLADIAEGPGDDAARLVYADWLDDRGEADRAEFIRIQCELAQRPADDERTRALMRREDALLARHDADWRGDLPGIPGVTWENFTRGFVEAVFVETVPLLLTHAAALFAAAPLRRLRVGRVGAGDAGRLAGCDYLARLSELNLGNNSGLDAAGVRALAESPHLANLAALLLHYNDLGDAAADALAESPHLTGLQELYLAGTGLSDVGVGRLARLGRFSRLAELDLRDNGVGDIGAIALAYYGDRPALTTLYLVNNQIGPAGAGALAAAGLPSLSRLYLNYNPIGNGGAIALAESPQRAGLRDLDLRRCDIRDAGGLALADSPHLGGLELLWLGGNRIRVETLGLLRRRFGDRLRL